MQLLRNFLRAIRVAQSALHSRAAKRNEVRLAIGRAQILQQGVGIRLGVFVFFKNVQLGAKTVHQQHIAVLGIAFALDGNQLAQHQLAMQPQARGHGCRQAGMVGLQAAGGDQRVGALFKGIGREIFQFAQLVARAPYGRHIVAFDKDARLAAQVLRQSVQFYQRGRIANKGDFGNHDALLVERAMGAATCSSLPSSKRKGFSSELKNG